MDLSSLTIDAARSAIQQRRTTALALAEAHYSHIQKEDGQIGAFLTLSKERALEQADRVDRMAADGKPLPPLAGVPVGIKDVMSTRGLRTTAGSKILEKYIPPYDCTAVARMEAAGAVMLGKTNCDEFAMGSSNENSAYGPVRNPRDLSRVPGGSSGGSAAAVAADMAVVALGSDTGGIDSPASSFLWRGWLDANLRPRIEIWSDCICIFARPHRTAGEDGERCRNCFADDRRPRSDGLDLG